MQLLRIELAGRAAVSALNRRVISPALKLLFKQEICKFKLGT